MSNQRFPYERSRWRSGERDTARQWHEALERLGAESVRIRLMQVNCSSASAMALGTENTMIRGLNKLGALTWAGGCSVSFRNALE
jgi:hypothetical protein